MSQYEDIMTALGLMQSHLETIERKIDRLSPPSLNMNDIAAGAGDLDLEDDSEGEIIRPTGNDPHISARSVVYKTTAGIERKMDPRKLEEKVQQVIAIATKRNDPYQLYERPDGGISIMVSNETVNEWNRRHPGPTG